MSTNCHLCGLKPAIKNSHVIPALVYRAIKSDSPTGFIRNPNEPNLRVQDGDKLPLLCSDCEDRFSRLESEFAEKAFHPFHHKDVDEFSYGPWLHRFLASVAWRTLILDIPDLEQAGHKLEHIVMLKRSAELVRLYLLGAYGLGKQISIHAYPHTAAHSCSDRLARIGPNVAIRRSIAAYTILNKRHGHAAVICNLAGFIGVLIIKGNPKDTWRNTKVSCEIGRMSPPYIVSSYVMGDFMDLLIETDRKWNSMSGTQQQKIRDAVSNSEPTAVARFVMLDQEIRSEP